MLCSVKVQTVLIRWSRRGPSDDTCVSYGCDMERVLTWLRMLGNTGAVANARKLSEEREREIWIVDVLTARLNVSDPHSAAA